jgi:hypothetical protein
MNVHTLSRLENIGRDSDKMSSFHYDGPRNVPCTPARCPMMSATNRHLNRHHGQAGRLGNSEGGNSTRNCGGLRVTTTTVREGERDCERRPARLSASVLGVDRTYYQAACRDAEFCTIQSSDSMDFDGILNRAAHVFRSRKSAGVFKHNDSFACRNCLEPKPLRRTSRDIGADEGNVQKTDRG